MVLINRLTELYHELLSKYPKGLSDTSTKKFDDFKDFFAECFDISSEDVYAVGSGTRPGNLEVRLSQGTRATTHTPLGLAFMIDKKDSADNRDKLTKSALVTVEKFLGRGKSSYDNILFLVYSEESIFLTGLIYTNKSTLSEKILAKFNIPHVKEVAPFSPVGDKVDCATGVNNEILYGPPGTGKTFFFQEMYDSGETTSSMVTFHQSFAYEDFVEGIKPVLSKGDNPQVYYKCEKGVFFNACEKAALLAGYSSWQDCINDTPDGRSAKFAAAISDGKIYTICIDEINRANIAAVFGDLISLIEMNKRLGAEHEATATLPYSKTLFGVPANLRIIGTMNTADKSITLLDAALRRRFIFTERLPNYDLIPDDVQGVNVAKLLETLNKRIAFLLSSEYAIGHTYFLRVENLHDLLSVFIFKIIPLLDDYFCGDYTKVKMVLGESLPCKENDFFIEESVSADVLFPNYDLEDKTILVKNPIMSFYLNDTENDIPKELFIKMYE